MFKRILLVICLLIAAKTYAQDSVKYRVILIGDAGEINDGQKQSLYNAAKHVIKGKTTTLYLGDNIYPVGMAIPGFGSLFKASKTRDSHAHWINIVT